MLHGDGSKGPKAVFVRHAFASSRGASTDDTPPRPRSAAPRPISVQRSPPASPRIAWGAAANQNTKPRHNSIPMWSRLPDPISNALPRPRLSARSRSGRRKRQHQRYLQPKAAQPGRGPQPEHPQASPQIKQPDAGCAHKKNCQTNISSTHIPTTSSQQKGNGLGGGCAVRAKRVDLGLFAFSILP